MRVDHRRGDVGVAQKVLDSADGIASLEKVSREGVSKRVTRGALRERGRARGAADLPAEELTGHG